MKNNSTAINPFSNSCIMSTNHYTIQKEKTRVDYHKSQAPAVQPLHLPHQRGAGRYMKVFLQFVKLPSFRAFAEPEINTTLQNP
jgi:hypothetical protein